MNKRVIIIASAVAVILIIVILSLTRGLGKPSQTSVPPVTNQIKNEMNGQSADSKAKPRTDINVTDIHYFDNEQWLVAKVAPSKSAAASSAVVVMRKGGYTYYTFLGPGSDFTGQLTEDIPEDVQNYLVSSGYANFNTSSNQ